MQMLSSRQLACKRHEYRIKESIAVTTYNIVLIILNRSKSNCIIMDKRRMFAILQKFAFYRVLPQRLWK